MATARAKALQQVPLFAGLSGRDREFLARHLDEVDIAARRTLISEGTPNDAFYVLLEGEVEVTVAGQPRRVLGPGEFFGEISMDYRVPATATVVTRTPVRAYVMSHAQYGALHASEPVLARLRAAMSARLLADRMSQQPPRAG